MKSLLTSVCLLWLSSLNAPAWAKPGKPVSEISFLRMGLSRADNNPLAVPTAPVLSGLLQNWTRNSDRVSEITAPWQDRSNNETGFEIQWGDTDQYSGGSASVGANATQYKIEGSWPGCGHRVYVRVRAKNADGNSAWSSGSVVTRIALPETPSSPTVGIRSSTTVEIRWRGANESYSRESEFIVQYSTSHNFSSPTAISSGQNTESKIITGLTPNTAYYFRIKTRNCAGDSEWDNLGGWRMPVIPATPRISTSLSQNWTRNSDRVTEITVAWTDNSDNETGFEVQWGNTDQYTGGSASVGANLTQYKIEGSWPGCGQRVYVRVRAKNRYDEASAWSSGSVVTSIALPETPNNVVATAKSSSEIELKWTGANESYSRESEFVIEYAPAPGFLLRVGIIEVRAGQNSESIIINGLTANTLYYLRIRAKNCTGQSAYSTVVSATTLVAPVIPPAFPSDLSLTPLLTDNRNNARLNWRDNANDETGFEIEASTNGTTYTRVTTTTANTTSYDVNMATSAKNYYRVRTVRGGAASGYSNVVEYEMGPESPLDLRATVVSSSQINLTWADRSTDETGYGIERSTDGSSFSMIATVEADRVTYQNTGLPPATTYYYRVRGMKGSAGSAYTHVVNAKTQDAPVVPRPSTPTNLAAIATSISQINLTWNDTSINEEGFDLERSVDNTNWGNLMNMNANTTTYAVTGLNASTKYFFRLRAKNGGGTSDWSNVADATTQTPPPPKPLTPANLRLKATTTINQISIEWDDLATDETAYEVSRSTGPNANWEVLKGDLAANTKDYTDKPVRSGQAYFYRVRAARNTDFSAYSNVLETVATVVSAITADDPVNWQVYPNPVVEAVRVQINSPATYTAVIRNAVGRELLRSTLRSADTIPVSDLPAGVYFLQITTSSQSKVIRLLKL